MGFRNKQVPFSLGFLYFWCYFIAFQDPSSTFVDAFQWNLELARLESLGIRELNTFDSME